MDARDNISVSIVDPEECYYVQTVVGRLYTRASLSCRGLVSHIIRIFIGKRFGSGVNSITISPVDYKTGNRGKHRVCPGDTLQRAINTNTPIIIIINVYYVRCEIIVCAT